MKYIRGEQKFSQDFLYFSQNQQEMSAIFLWLILNVPLSTAAPRNNTTSRACAKAVKMACYGNVRFKQRAVSEFLVTE